jgi:hypothetical protein
MNKSETFRLDQLEREIGRLDRELFLRRCKIEILEATLILVLQEQGVSSEQYIRCNKVAYGYVGEKAKKHISSDEVHQVLETLTDELADLYPTGGGK